MLKNISGQKVRVFAFDYSTGAPKTGDAANITAYVSKNNGTPVVLTDTSATEVDSTKAPGCYDFDLSQSETNADELSFTGKSTTSNVAVIGPRYVTRVDVGYVAGESQWSVSATATAGGSNYLTFPASTIATSQCYPGCTLRIVSGSGAGQWMPVSSVDSSGGYVTKAYAPTGWTFPYANPSSSSVFQIDPSPGYAIATPSSVWSDVYATSRKLTSDGASAILNQQMTESYASAGVVPTMAQALMEILQFLTQASVSGSSMTVKKLDGATTAMTLTLNSSYPASLPSSISRI